MGATRDNANLASSISGCKESLGPGVGPGVGLWVLTTGVASKLDAEPLILWAG